MKTQMSTSKLTYEQGLLYKTQFRVKLYEDGGVWFAAGLEAGKRDIFQLSNIDNVEALVKLKEREDVTAGVSHGWTGDYYYEWMLFYASGLSSLVFDGRDRDKFTKADFDIIHHQGDTMHNQLSIRIVCSQGRVQSLRGIRHWEDAQGLFERYKARVQAVHAGANGNPECTQEWLDGLTYTVEDRQGNVIND